MSRDTGKAAVCVTTRSGTARPTSTSPAPSATHARNAATPSSFERKVTPDALSSAFLKPGIFRAISESSHGGKSMVTARSVFFGERT